MNSFQRFFSFDPKAMLLGGSPIAWGRKINWSQIVWSRKWYIIKNCSFCIISLSRMHYFKNWSQILKGNAALQPANHLWGQFFPWQVHNSQKCIFVIFWHSHLEVVSGDLRVSTLLEDAKFLTFLTVSWHILAQFPRYFQVCNLEPVNGR